MIVMKFGGTSVGSAPAFGNAIALVERAVRRDPVVVVSALAGVTDLLVRFAANRRRAPIWRRNSRSGTGRWPARPRSPRTVSMRCWQLSR